MRGAVFVLGLRRRHLVISCQRESRFSRVKMESAPQVMGSSARQRGCEPPPHSSSKITLSPALLNIAECQKEKFGSETAVMRLGRTGSRDVEQDANAEYTAPAARPKSG